MIRSASPEAHLHNTVSSLLSEIRDMMSGAPAVPGTRNRTFAGRTAESARDAAVSWLRDFDTHEPVRIRSIRTEARDGHYVAIVAYQPW
jgi:hypothetical protein